MEAVISLDGAIWVLTYIINRNEPPTTEYYNTYREALLQLGILIMREL